MNAQTSFELFELQEKAQKLSASYTAQMKWWRGGGTMTEEMIANINDMREELASLDDQIRELKSAPVREYSNLTNGAMNYKIRTLAGMQVSQETNELQKQGCFDQVVSWWAD